MSAHEAFSVYNRPPQPYLVEADLPYLASPGVRGGNIAFLGVRPRIPEQPPTRIDRAAGDVAEVIRLASARADVLQAQPPEALQQGPEALGSGEVVLSPVETLSLVPEIAGVTKDSDAVFEPHTVKTPLFRPEITQPVAESTSAKKSRPGTIRPATSADIERMVEKDMKDFSKVYAGYNKTQEELRAELIEKFTGRFNKVGGDWNQLYEQGEKFGFMMCCPTNKTPEEFQSWEQTTDNGTLDTTYDPNGKNIYIVSLTMEGCGQAARNMIFVNQIGKMIEGDFDNFFFESRLPGLRDWIADKYGFLHLDLDNLDEERKLGFANIYFNTKKTNSKGKEVALDPLVRIYEGVGCTFDRVVPNAYNDEPSLNFGTVGVFKNPMPKMLRKSRLARKAVGGTMRWASRQPWFGKVAEKLF